MAKDLVVGLDSSTSGTKAIAWTRTGDPVAEGRTPLPLSNPRTGWFEQEARDWWDSACRSLRELTSRIAPDRIAGLAISNQRETFAVFDREGAALRPGMLWLDDRARANVPGFGETFGAERIHAISGKPLDVNPCLYRLLWMREHEPAIFDEMDVIADVHGYLAFRLTGRWVTSIASADPMGMLDMVERRWSDDILAAAGVRLEKMLELEPPGGLLGSVSASAATATGMPEGVPIFAGGGDGQCAGTGAGALRPGRAFLNLGTAVVSGTFTEDYTYHRAYRTETAIADAGYILETVVRSGTFLIDWLLLEIFGFDKSDRAAQLAALEREAARRPIGASGIMVAPYWQGAMTPHWDNAARGVICGLSGSTRKSDLFRGVLEGIAMEMANCVDVAAAASKRDIDHYVAIGGGASSNLWVRILTDVLGKPVMRSSTLEASSLGAAMAAAKGVGWYASFAEAAASMVREPEEGFSPHPPNVEIYRGLRQLHGELWPKISEWNQRLADFSTGVANPSR
jgi:xylulokinase